MGHCVLYLMEEDIFFCCMGTLTIKVPHTLTHCFFNIAIRLFDLVDLLLHIECVVIEVSFILHCTV